MNECSSNGLVSSENIILRTSEKNGNISKEFYNGNPCQTIRNKAF